MHTVSYRFLQFVIAFTCFAAVPYSAFPHSAFADTLTESTTGLELDAPAGFSVAYDGQGNYTITKGNLKASFVIGISPFDAMGTAEDFIASSGIKSSKLSEQDGYVIVKGKLDGKNVQVNFRAVDEGIEVSTFPDVGGSSGGKKNKKKKKKKKKKSKKKKKKKSKKRTKRARLSSEALVAAPLTAADVILMNQIIKSRRGGRTIPLPVTMPMRQFVTADQGASALVPDLPNLQCGGQQGVISCFPSAPGPALAIINLGIPNLVTYSPFFANGGPTSGFVSAQQAITTVFPQAVSGVQVTGVAQVPGTDGWIGGGYQSSGLFVVRFNAGGVAWDALMVSACSADPFNSISWLWYTSYVAVPVGSSPALGNAVINSWASWNNENANAVRLRQTLNTILTTPPPGNPIDQGVFDAIHQMWVDYIRGPFE